jgi:hypothetical protein
METKVHSNSFEGNFMRMADVEEGEVQKISFSL